MTIIDSAYRDPAVADVYRRIAVPTHFVPPGRDLAGMLRATEGERMLDVGTGTGAVATAMVDSGVSCWVVGIDRAFAMLSAPGESRSHPLVAGEAPGLPFAADTFAAVAASFVLPHCRDYAIVLGDMIRVCRLEGRIGISAWGSSSNAPGRVWKQIVYAYIDPNRLQEAFRAAVPWEEWFYSPRNVEHALVAAGLTDVQRATREYTIAISRDDYIAMKRAGVEGRLIRQLAGEDAWADFTIRVGSEFQRRFTESITFVRDVHFGLGVKRRGWDGALRR